MSITFTKEKHNNRHNKINEEKRAEDISHIQSFPTESSHFWKKKFQKN